MRMLGSVSLRIVTALTRGSHAERVNLTMRMAMRRFTRLTSAFSKKLENHAHMVALYALWYTLSISTRHCEPRQLWQRGSERGSGRWKTRFG
jgi:hypothetical protein